MNKLFLLSIGALVSMNSFAARKHVAGAVNNGNITNATNYSLSRTAGKTTATGDTLILSNISATDTPTLYLAGVDSGYVSGTDAWGDMGFAERYDFSGADSSLKVIGVMAAFGGRYVATTTKQVTFYTWSQAAQSVSVYGAPYYDSGLPDIALDSVHVPLQQLGIHTVTGSTDTLKAHMFTTPTAYLTTSFFVGYTINYNPAALAGDTIGVYTTLDGERTSAMYTTSGTDTIFNNQNVTMYDDGSWHDNGVDNFMIFNDYLMFPIVIVKENLSVQGITNRNLTFFGSYPNPASNNTTIEFSLAQSTNVTIAVMDVTGKVVKTQQEKGLSEGKHAVGIDVANLPAGDYTYVIRSANGGGIASKLTVIR